MARSLCLALFRPAHRRCPLAGYELGYELDSRLAGAPDVIVIECPIDDANLRHGISPAQSRSLHEEIIAQSYDAAPGAPAGPVPPAAPARGGFVSLEVPSSPVQRLGPTGGAGVPKCGRLLGSLSPLNPPQIKQKACI